MERTQRKKIVIILIYLAVFSLIISGLYSIFKPKPSCFDGIQNQNEKGLDCGGICQKVCDEIKAQDLIVKESALIPSGVVGKYDFYVKIFNPNAVFGGRSIAYEIKFNDATGNAITAKQGSSFILPGEEKYIIENNVELSSEPISQIFKIVSVDWARFDDYYEKPDIQIVNKNYSEVSDGIGFANAQGLLRNRSSFDFDSIKIQVILKDLDGKILALNSTEMKTIRAGEDRDFKVFWPSSFPGIVSSMEVQAEVNVFNSDSFLRKLYGNE